MVVDVFQWLHTGADPARKALSPLAAARVIGMVGKWLPVPRGNCGRPLKKDARVCQPGLENSNAARKV
jgi:hypothetical protein